MTDQTVSDVLYGAADYIDEHGHHTGNSFADMESLSGAACAIGGMYAATPESPALRGRAVNALRVHIGSPFVAEWNDRRTAEEVIETLRAAAVIEAAKESADDREQVSA